jgi:menaquinone-dependent protoporphyrinogen oxidase
VHAISAREGIMARVLIVFGTTNGQTAKIASRMGGTLRNRGHEVTVASAAGDPPGPAGYGAVLVAASVHAGHFQREVTRWVQRYAYALNRVPSAFVAVSLGILQKDPAVQEEIRGIDDRFLIGCGWRPRWTLPVAGALTYTRYNLVTRWMMRRIAARAGGDTDTSRDYEYTDWAAVSALCETLAGTLAPATAAGMVGGR